MEGKWHETTKVDDGQQDLLQLPRLAFFSDRVYP